MNAARIDTALCAEIRARVRLSDIVGRRVVLKKRGREHSGRCPFHAEKTPSFTVNDGKGFFHCFGCGAHGDAFGFLMRTEALSFPQAVALLAAEAGLGDRVAGGAPHPDPLPQGEREKGFERQRQAQERRRAAAEAKDEARTLEHCRALWRQAVPIRDTPAEAYLAARGLDVGRLRALWGERAPLRFVPRLFHWESSTSLPALLAPIVRHRATGAPELIGLHRTWIRVDGSGKAAVSPSRKVLGRVSGGAIRLGPVGGDGRLVLAEGIETAMSVMLASGIPAWAAVSLGNLAGPGLAAAAARSPLHPGRVANGRCIRLPTAVPDLDDARALALPASVRRLTICADNDSADPESARALFERAANRYALCGIETAIAWPPAGSDFNDVIRGPARAPGQEQKVGAG